MTPSQIPKVIGGLFGIPDIPDIPPEKPPFLTVSGQLWSLANARSGLWVVVQSLRPDKVWLPSFLCDALVEVLPPWQVSYYPVNAKLKVATSAWLGEVSKNDLIVVIDYFGFPADVSLVNQAKERQAWVLEDASQALLTRNVDGGADFVLYSPRKFLGVPDGGILSCAPHRPLPEIELQPAPSAWWLRALAAALKRRDFDRGAGDRSWFSLFQETEAHQPVGSYRISEFSQALLEHAFDYSAITTQRRANYLRLLEYLHPWALFPYLPDGVTPLGFPVCVDGRDQVRARLFAHEIYPPIHWPVPASVPAEYQDPRRLASKIMTIPCDQRYNIEDMDEVIKNFVRGMKA